MLNIFEQIMWCVSTWMEENMEYQQLASTNENAFTKSSSTIKKFLPNHQVPLKKIYRISKYHWKSSSNIKNVFTES